MPTAPGETRPKLLADRYRVGPRLGGGAMGDVHDGLDVRLERRVAIKLLRTDLSSSEDVRQRFEREARVAAQLSHPNVLSVFDSGEEQGRAFIVMERLSGRTLAHEIADAPFYEARLRAVASQILAALDAAHDARIVHRDIKPSNVLLASRGQVKVADFGIAKMLEAVDLTATGMLVGTPAYIAPERHTGAPASPRTDLYSLGVLLYEAASGSPPFRGDSPLAVAHAALAGSAPPLQRERPDLDPRLVAVIEQAMALDPASRFATAPDMSRALGSRSATTATVRLETPSPTATMRRPVGRTGRGRRPERRPAPKRRATRRVSNAVAALLMVVTAAFTVGLIALFSGGSPSTATPPPSAVTAPSSPSQVPAPLNRALTQLGQAVRP